jgi:hypothetical protein
VKNGRKALFTGAQGFFAALAIADIPADALELTRSVVVVIDHPAVDFERNRFAVLVQYHRFKDHPRLLSRDRMASAAFKNPDAFLRA